MSSYDVIVIGSGAGGGTLVHHLAPSGKRILLLERGDWLPREPQNWSAADVFIDNRYISEDTWYDADTAKAFQPQVHYFVGGATKLSGRLAFFTYLGVHLYYLGGPVGRRVEVLIKWIGARFGERQSALVEGELSTVERASPTREATEWAPTSSP